MTYKVTIEAINPLLGSRILSEIFITDIQSVDEEYSLSYYRINSSEEYGKIIYEKSGNIYDIMETLFKRINYVDQKK